MYSGLEENLSDVTDCFIKHMIASVLNFPGLFLCPLVGLLHAGDKLVEVNGHPVFGLEPEQIIKILVRGFTSFTFSVLFEMLLLCGCDLISRVFPHQAHTQATVVFKVVPITDRPINNKTMVSYFFHPGFLCYYIVISFERFPYNC